MFERSVFSRRGLVSALAAVFGLAVAATTVTPAQAYNPPFAALVVDVKTGQTLHEENADARRFPASLTKVMTLYMVFEQLESGRLRLDSPLTVSARAAAEPPSKIGMRPGSTISVENAILALVTRSANDVAAVIAENLGGSVENFARQMTSRARALGMNNTTFRNASGLPDPGQVTTARDLARLAIAIQDRFPQYYGYFQRRSFNFAGKTHGNHNRLLGRVEGVDGIKTGFIRASGFNLMTNAKSNGRHIVTIVLGGRTGAHRDGIVQRLVERHLPRAFAGPRRTPTIGAPAVAVASVAPAAIAIPSAPPRRPQDLTAPIAVASAPVTQLDLTRLSPAVATAAAGASTMTPGSLRAQPQPPTQALAYAAASPVAVPLPPAPVPQVASTGALEQPPASAAPSQIAALASAAAADPTPAVSGTVSPWIIQIGAVPSEDAAFDMLQRAQSRLGGVLAEAAPFTEAVRSRGTVLYRARFSGFEAAGEARDACKALERQGFACIALRS